jgi:hypothetical protein
MGGKGTRLGLGAHIISTTQSRIWKVPDPMTAQLKLARQPAFGNPANLTTFEMVPFNGFLYTGTLKPTSGYEIWKTESEGTPPYRWTKVISHGGYRGPLNEATPSMFVFDDTLYIGSRIQNGGYDRTYDIGPAASELICIFRDDTCELIVGEARSTPHGFKRDISGFESGFPNGYFCRTAEYDGVLYLVCGKYRSE